MTYTENTSVFLDDGELQDISEDYWVQVLEDAGSFAVDALWDPFPRDLRPGIARQLYQIVTEARQRASYWLAKPFEEHSAGTNQNSVLWRGETRSWGNATSVRLQVLTGWTMYFDEFRGREYVRYANVIDSVRDALFRIVDPDYVYVKEGRRTVREVGERFVGLGPNTDNYVAGLVRRMNEYIADERNNPVSAQISGFKWEPADSDHYTRGRTVPIRGGAQHYTGGTNSLDWLTKTSVPPVSSTFLVKHEPTLTDRGWQLVRLEDTPWTTAFANSYTVSIEYEHHPDIHNGIPDVAFTVLAQTWIDIAAKVKDLKLGFIPLDRSGIRGHKDWVNNPSLICPDGVFVDRIVAEINRLQGGQDVDFDKVPTEPDPWRDHLGGNPYGREFWIPQVFVKNIRDNGGFDPVGFVTSGAFVDGAQLVQYFERGRLELNEDGAVTRGLVGLEVLAGRYPDLLP